MLDVKHPCLCLSEHNTKNFYPPWARPSCVVSKLFCYSANEVNVFSERQINSLIYSRK